MESFLDIGNPSIPTPNEMPKKNMNAIILICVGIMVGITISQIIISGNEEDRSKRTD
jgi:capsular polysaccharide biosynthesis protein